MPAFYNHYNCSKDFDIANSYSTILLAVWGTLLSILLVIAIAGNGVVIGTLLRTWNTAGTKPGNLLAFVLACCDLLHSTINTVFILCVAATPCVHPAVVKTHFGLLVLLAGGSNMTLCIISLNRYYVVAKPNTNDKTSRQRVKKLLILAWSLVLATTFLCIILFDIGRERHFHNPNVPTGSSMLIALILLVILPILIMMVTYLRLFRLVKMRCRPAAVCNRPAQYPPEISNVTESHQACGMPHPGSQGGRAFKAGNQSSSVNHANGDGKSPIVADAPSIFGATTAPNKILVRQQKLMQGPPDLRIAVTLLILLGVFILCWTPAIVLAFGGASGNTALFHPIAFAVVTICIFIVPACNPVVYSLRNSQFRAAANEFLDSVVNLCRRQKS